MKYRKTVIDVTYLNLCAILDEKFGPNWIWHISFQYDKNGDQHSVGKLWVKAQDLSEYEAVSHLDNGPRISSEWKEITAFQICIDLILREITRKETEKWLELNLLVESMEKNSNG